MPYFCHQVCYTKEAWARLMQNPQDRLEAVRAPIEKLGGKVHASFFAFGDFDVLAITEMPDTISAAAISMAFAGGGAVSKINTTTLLTGSQALEALRKAGTSGYKSITSESAASTSAGR
ncbi:MAG: GYD domain-containing protein [Candidatus Acidiferrum sp.]